MASNLKLASAWGTSTGWFRSAAPSRLYAVAGLGLLSLFALIVLIRCTLGAFSGPMCPVGYALCIFLASLFCCSLKIAAEWPPYRLSPPVRLVFGILIGLPLDVLAVALLSAGWTYLGVAATLGWLALVAWFSLSADSVDGLRWLCGEVIWPEIERFLCPVDPTAPRQNTPGRPTASPQASEAPKVAPLPDLPRESLISLAREPVLNDQPHDAIDGELISRLQRRFSESGADLLEGQLVATFERGSKQAILHVPFTPPFAVPPRVDCEVADGSEVRIKVGAVFTYGVRVELKRNAPDLPEQDVAVEIYAESPAPDAPATVSLK